MVRKLASVQRIKEIKPHPNADRLELATVQGWQVVVLKEQFRKDEFVAFFEIDSILPDGPAWSEFLRDRKFRVKTIKLRKEISQGLCVPLIACVKDSWEVPYCEGDDLTERLGVTKYDPEGDKERRVNANNKRKVVPMRWLLKCGSWGSKLHKLLYPRTKGNWPVFDTWSFPHTDETRIQNMKNLKRTLGSKKLYATEKLDGQSISVFYHRKEKVGILKRGLFGVCSRNIWYKTELSNNWWNIVKQHRLDEMLPEYCDNVGRSLAIQGEIVGEGIQGNPYVMKDKELYIFSIYDLETGKYLSDFEKTEILNQLQLMNVPRLADGFRRKYDWGVDDYLENAEGKSLLNLEVEREGIVWRDVASDEFSFKCISNKHLLSKGRNA